uniref:hypothetical protein n=1 Tax=Algoriphagus sp. TaxID=1872435 RepID=UPI004047D8D2
KPCSADGTGVTPGRVGRRHIIEALRSESKGFFLYEVQSKKYEIRNTETKLMSNIECKILK